VGNNMRLIAVAVCLGVALCPGNAVAQGNSVDAKMIEGLWSGSWGGGERDGVVFQPVRAELYIKGDHIELHGFRNASKLAGTVRFDVGAKRMRITPAAPVGGQPLPKPIEFEYELKGDMLTLTDSDKISIALQKHSVAHNPMANVAVELVSAAGINEAGDLLVTEFTVLRVGQTGATYLRPADRKLSTKQATVLLVQDTGVKKVTVTEARGLLRKTTPVVVTYRQEDRPSSPQLHELWKDLGSSLPDDEAVWQTFSRVLRPGTLVFILSARENIPRP
jgi:hypothetical protein